MVHYGQKCTNRTQNKNQIFITQIFDNCQMEWEAHLTNKLGSYDIIVGCNLLCELGVDINFSTSTCTWENSTIPMRNPEVDIKQTYIVEESGPIKQATTRLKRILDAKYEAANIPQLVKKE